MNLKNILSAIVLSCFLMSVAYAGVDRKSAFAELTTVAMISLFGGVYINGGLGYKHNLDSTNYFGYVLADINVGIPALTGAEAIFAGELNLEYGYEFMRDSLFSFGLNVSPIVPLVSIFKGRDLSISGSRGDRINWNLIWMSSLGVFGNFNINDSFEVAIEAKATSQFLNRVVEGNLTQFASRNIDLRPIVELKGRYYF